MKRTRSNLATRLRESVILQSPTTPTTGETDPSYTDVVTVRAEVLSLRGNENMRGRQVESIATWKVIIRHYGSITPEWRIKWGSKTLGIIAAYDPDQMGAVTVCECKEEQP